MRIRLEHLALSITSFAILYWFLPEIRHASLAYNDGVNHMAIIRRMDEIWNNGGNLTDFWMGHINFGHALLRSYQFFMHLFVWGLHKTILYSISIERCFNIIVTLMAMILPWTCYYGFLMLGVGAIEAAVSAISLTLLHESSGYGLSLTNFTFSGYGTYNQLFATVTLPLALGFAHRSLRNSEKIFKNTFWGALFFSITFMSHILTGYFACLWIAIDAISAAFFEKKRFKEIVKALASYGALCVLWTAHWVIPMAQDSLLQHRSISEPPFKWDGFGATGMLSQLGSGALLDAGRFPIITILAGLGIAFCVLKMFSAKKQDLPSLNKTILTQSILWILLSFGPSTWGAGLLILPFAKMIHWHRAFAITQIMLCLCAGIGFGTVWKWLIPDKTAPWVHKITGMILCLSLLLPVLRERQHYFYTTNDYWLQDTENWWNNNSTHYQAALKYALNHNDARYEVGNPWNYGHKELVTSYIPFYALLTQYNVEVLGAIHHHQSHSEVLAFRLDVKNALHRELANIHYVGLKKEEVPPFEWKPALTMSNAILYETNEKPSYFLAGHTTADTYCTNSENIIESTAIFLRSPLLEKKIFPKIKLAANCTQELAISNKLPTLEKAIPETNLSLGKIISTEKFPGKNSDIHLAELDFENPGMVLFKMNYHPSWVAELDGKKISTYMVVPSFIGVSIPKGKHRLTLYYQPELFKTVLTWISFLSFITISGIYFRNKNA